MIAIVDYGLGNISSIRNIYKRLSVDCIFASTPEQISKASKLILPGVGSFDEAMKLLESSSLLPSLNDSVLNRNIPILGVCVGMQIMANSSEEGSSKGLGWIDAVVKRIDRSTIPFKPKLPHMGWNSIDVKTHHSILKDVDNQRGFYFLHSFHFCASNDSEVLATTNYGQHFSSAVHKNNIFGFQFHPEKSHDNGIKLLKNFSELTLC